MRLRLLGVMSAVSFSVFGAQALLEVVNDLFEEQTDLEKIVRKIMHRAQTLLKCERCSVQLLEDIESPVWFLFLLRCMCVCVSGSFVQWWKATKHIYSTTALKYNLNCL